MTQTATNPKTGEQLQLDEATNTWVPVPTKPAEWSELIGNIPESAAKAGGDVLSVLNPANWPEMASTLGKTVVGGMAKRNREMSEQFQETVGIKPYEKSEWEKYPKLLGQHVKGRYGSPEAIKETLITDPAGAALDLSGLLSGGGSMLAKQGGIVGKIGKAGMATDPINLMTGGAKTAIGALTPKTLPADLYKSAAKFSTTLDRTKGIGTRTKLAETAIKHKLLPTEAGLNQMQALRESIGGKIDDLVSQATASGKNIPKSQIFKHLKQARKDVGGVKLEAKKDLKQVNEVARNFDEQLKKLGKNSLTPDELQKLKVDAYKKIDFDIKNQKAEAATNIARKAIAKAAKEGVEQSAPEVSKLNKVLGDLIELQDPLTQSASRIENRDLLGIGTPLKAMAGGEMAGTKGAIAGFATGVLESKKAKLAITLKEMQEAGLTNMLDPSLRNTLIQQGLLQSGRAEDE